MKLKRSFSQEDLTPENKARIETLVDQQAKRLFVNDKRNRTLDQIKASCWMSTPAELYMSQLDGWKMAEDVYHDVVDDNGDFVEIKCFRDITSENDSIIGFIKKLHESDEKAWNKSKSIYFFRYEPDLEHPTDTKFGSYHFVCSYKVERNAS